MTAFDLCELVRPGWADSCVTFCASAVSSLRTSQITRCAQSNCAGYSVIRHYCIHSVTNLVSLTTSTKVGLNRELHDLQKITQGTAKCIVHYREDGLNMFSLLNSSSSRKYSHNSTGIDSPKPGWKNNRPTFRVRCSVGVTESVNIQCSQAWRKRFRLGVVIVIAPADNVIHEMGLSAIGWILLEGWEGRIGPIMALIVVFTAITRLPFSSPTANKNKSWNVNKIFLLGLVIHNHLSEIKSKRILGCVDEASTTIRTVILSRVHLGAFSKFFLFLLNRTWTHVALPCNFKVRVRATPLQVSTNLKVRLVWIGSSSQALEFIKMLLELGKKNWLNLRVVYVEIDRIFP